MLSSIKFYSEMLRPASVPHRHWLADLRHSSSGQLVTHHWGLLYAIQRQRTWERKERGERGGKPAAWSACVRVETQMMDRNAEKLPVIKTWAVMTAVWVCVPWGMMDRSCSCWGIFPSSGVIISWGWWVWAKTQWRCIQTNTVLWLTLVQMYFVQKKKGYFKLDLCSTTGSVSCPDFCNQVWRAAVQIIY